MNNSNNTTPAGGGVGQSPANLPPPPLHLGGASGQRAANQICITIKDEYTLHRDDKKSN